MNIIEEKIKKFNIIKRKLQNRDLDELTKTNDKTILYILNNQKTINNNKTDISFNLTKEKKEVSKKETTKFMTKKFEEQKILKNNYQKEIFPNLKEDKLNQNKSNLIVNTQNSNKQNFTDNVGRNNASNAFGSTINLLNMANGDYKPQEVQKIFEKERFVEEKKKMKENEKKVKLLEKNNEVKKKDLSAEIDDFDDFEDEEIEKDKNKSYIKNKNESFNNLSMLKKESSINLIENFNIFDETKMMKDNDNCFDNIGYMYNNDYLPYNSFDKKRNKNENKSNNIIEKNENLNENENNINNIYNTPKKEKENNNNQNDYMNISNNSNCNSLKICIPLDKLDLNIPQENNKNLIHKGDIIKRDNNLNEKKYLGKKTKNIENSIKKNSLPSKSEPKQNIINIEHKNFILKTNKKVIMDDEDEEEEQKLTEKNKVTNSLFKSPIPKNEIKNDSLGVFLTNDGTKFTLKIESDIKSKNNNKSVSDFFPKSLNNEEFNNIPNKNMNLNPAKDISININNSNKIKNNNKNKINLINKNKNGSQNNQNKDIINSSNYDLICLNSIKKILININEKLSKESKGKISIKKCLENIEDIKKNNDEIQRKKQTYTAILKPIYNLFSFFNDNKIYKKYIDEIFQLLEYIQKYYKYVKKYHESINSNQFYYKRKLAFKYVFSKFELKLLDYNSLKKIITKKDNSSNESNNNNEDNTNMQKILKTYKRYIKTSAFLLKEIKDFREKINNSPKTKSSESIKTKFESCPANIQMSPHLMSYIRLFNHCSIILTFFSDCKKFLNELEEKNGVSKDKTTTFDKNRGKSVQIKNNINGFNNKSKERDKSIEKHKEREKFKEK